MKLSLDIEFGSVQGINEFMIQIYTKENDSKHLLYFDKYFANLTLMQITFFFIKLMIMYQRIAPNLYQNLSYKGGHAKTACVTAFEYIILLSNWHRKTNLRKCTYKLGFQCKTN